MELREKIGLYGWRSKHFVWSEALWLPRWNMFYQEPNQVEVQKIVGLCFTLDKVRDYVGVPFNVTSWIRPTIEGKGDYNALIGGARLSMHREGAAVDFVPQGKTVDATLAMLFPKLEYFGLRAENNGESKGRAWVHLDTLFLPPGAPRVVGVGSSRPK